MANKMQNSENKVENITAEISNLIRQADSAIREERFDDLMDYYTEDAVLVIMPGKEAHGKTEIKAAFIKIAAYFANSLQPRQGKMLILPAGDTALVLSQTLLDADNKNSVAVSLERRATYVYRKMNGRWLCAVDNSYGTDLLADSASK